MPEWYERWDYLRLRTDQESREEFLRDSQPFIRHVASRVCLRNLEWGRDEELSEALIAFNEALEHFEPERGVPFLAYARLLIKRRLIDYHRRQRAAQASLPLEREEVAQAVELHLSLPDFIVREQNRERAAEIAEYAAELAAYGLKFADLVAASPKHRDTRETLQRAARVLAQEPELWRQVEEKNKIPLQALAHKSGIHPKTLERGRRYILAVALLIAHHNNYVYLREYVLPGARGIGQ